MKPYSIFPLYRFMIIQQYLVGKRIVAMKGLSIEGRVKMPDF